MAPVLLILAGACAASASRSGPARSVEPSPVAFQPPPGVHLATDCVSTGPETCFDATDNNCNGLIDEGCGVPTGPLHFAIAWETESNLDLDVLDPRGGRAGTAERVGRGLVKDRDCPADRSCRGQNTENVFFLGDKPQGGTYVVEIKLEAAAPREVYPVRVRFGGKVGSKTFSALFDLRSSRDEKVFSVQVE